MAITTTDFLNRVKAKVFLPEQQAAVSDAQIIQWAQEELCFNIAPFLNSLQASWNTFRVRTPLQDPATGADLYPVNMFPIPTRAMGKNIIEIKWVDTATGYAVNLPQIDIGSYEYFQQTSMRQPYGFMIISEGIQLVTQIDMPVKGTIEIFYMGTLPLLTVPSSGRLFTAITDCIHDTDTHETTIMTDSIASDADLLALSPISPVGTYKYYDICAADSGTVIASDVPLTRLSATQWVTMPDTFDPSTIANMRQFQRGNFPVSAPYTTELEIRPAAITSKTPIQSIVDPWLVTLVSARVMESIGDETSLGVLLAVADREKRSLTSVLGSRIQNEAKKIVNRRGLFSFIGLPYWTRRGV
jgi:hypothetical protein